MAFRRIVAELKAYGDDSISAETNVTLTLATDASGHEEAQKDEEERYRNNVLASLDTWM